MNIWTGVGRLGRAAELKYTAGGQAVSSFSIAVDRPKKQGKKQQPIWLRVTLWGKLAEAISKYLTKGKQVAISGELDIREYESKGEKRTSVEINARNVTMLGSGEKRDGETTAPAQDNTETPATDFADDPF